MDTNTDHLNAYQDAAIATAGGQEEWDKLSFIIQKILLENERNKAMSYDQTQGELDLMYVEDQLQYTELTVGDYSMYDRDATIANYFIENCREYKIYKRERLLELKEKQINMAEYRNLTDNRFKSIRNEIRRRTRSRSVNISRKSSSRNTTYAKLHAKDRFSGTMSDFEGKTIVNSLDGTRSIYIPDRNSIARKVYQLKENCLASVSNDKIKKIHVCNIAGHVMGNVLGRFTCKVSFVDELGNITEHAMDKFMVEVARTFNNLVDYPDRDENFHLGTITITYSIIEWRGLNNWFPSIKPNASSNYIKFKDFKLFIANNENINCVKQCVDLMGGVYDPKLDIKDMFNGRKVVTYVPRDGSMYLIERFSDLLCEYDDELLNNTDCTNIVRLVMFAGHVGVITKIDEKKVNKMRVQTYRELPKLNEEENYECSIFVDIEAFMERETIAQYNQTPYLICWCEDEGDVKKRVGENCVEKFVDDIINKYSEKEIVMYAWYGSGYDYQHIFKHLKKRAYKNNCILRNNSIIYAKLQFPNGCVIHLKDPYLFLLTSLDKAAKAFGVTNKGAFPHSVVKGFDNLDDVLDRWFDLKMNYHETELEDGSLYVTRKEVYNYHYESNTKSILDHAIEYCSMDVVAMREVWFKFCKLVREIFGMEITPKLFTLSQLSMRLMESMFDPGVELYVPSREEYDMVSKAIYGGRVVAKNGVYNEDVLYADVVSLYPSAMRLEEHGYGKPKRVNEIDWNKHGVYQVKLTHKDDTEPKGYKEFVPHRDKNGKLCWQWRKHITGTFHTYDLLIAYNEGYKIEVFEGLEYPYKGIIFDGFIDKLFKVKEEHSHCDCMEQPCPIRMIAKIALNGGGYGKFVQKPIDTDVHIVERDVMTPILDKMKTNENGLILAGNTFVPKPYLVNLDGDEYDKLVYERVEDPYYATQCGISILSSSRYRLYNLASQFPDMQVVYSDTDSLFIRKNSVDHEKFVEKCGKKLGQLDNTIDGSKDNVISKMVVAGPKMYAYEYNDANNAKAEVKHCKGVPTSMLQMNHFEQMCNNNKIIYNQIVMRKKLTGVKTDVIDKKIIQTGAYKVVTRDDLISVVAGS